MTLMDAAFYFQLSWAMALLGWLVATLAVSKAWRLWRTNGDLANRFNVLKTAYLRLKQEHAAWAEEDQTDPNGISFDNLRAPAKKKKR